MKLISITSSKYIFIFFAIIQQVAFAQNTFQLWDNLPLGQYKVGYKVVEMYDYSRTFKSPVDYKGDAVNEEIARPIQVSVWYPTVDSTQKKNMLYNDYAAYYLNEVDFKPIDDNRRQQSIETFRKIMLSAGGNTDKVAKILSKSMYSVENAAEKSGKFPVILYAPSYSNIAFENAILMEYLASYGYIIYSSPSVSAYSRKMTPDLNGSQSQVRDLEFLYALAMANPNVDKRKIGTLGFSFGGLSNVIIAFRNTNISAVVSFDGNISFDDYKPVLPHYQNAKAQNFRVPFMLMLATKRSKHNLNFYDSLRYSNAYLLNFNDLVHLDFASSYIFNNLHASDNISDEQLKIKNLAYSAICKYTLNFFNVYLKNDADSKLFLLKSASQNGFQKLSLTVQKKDAMKAPPTEQQFMDIIKREGIAKAIEVYRSIKREEKKAVVFTEDLLNSLGYEYLRTDRIDESIEIFKLNVEEFPKSANAYDSLGEAYMTKGNKANAIENYKKSLQLDPQNNGAKQRLIILEKM